MYYNLDNYTKSPPFVLPLYGAVATQKHGNITCVACHWVEILQFSRRHHLALEDKLVDHPQDEVGPEDVESLEHQQQGVEEEVPRERVEVVQRFYHGGEDHPGDRQEQRDELAVAALRPLAGVTQGVTCLKHV